MDLVTVKKFSELCGLTEQAIRANIKKGKWLVKHQYMKSPDNKIYISIKGVEKWITN